MPPSNACTHECEAHWHELGRGAGSESFAAWPIPDRVQRGDEIVGTTLDLVPECKKRLTMALALNLVVGGLRARWRMRPPLWRWLYYRLGGRLSRRWNRWMLKDLRVIPRGLFFTNARFRLGSR
jgi:hypothetical protein